MAIVSLHPGVIYDMFVARSVWHSRLGDER